MKLWEGNRLIEIGNERTFQSGARQLSSLLGTFGTLLLLVWLARGILSLSNYSADFLIAVFGLYFVKGLLDTRTNLGLRRAVSSFLGSVVGSIVLILILILVLGWIAGLQGDPLPARITQPVPNLVIVAVIAGIGAYAFYQIAPRIRGPVARGPAVLVSPSTSLDFGEVRVSTKKDSVTLPIRGTRRTIGAVVLGDVTTTFETPMGPVTGNIPGPVTTLGIPFRGQRAERDEISKLTGKSLSQLLDETPVDTSIPRGEIFASGFEGNPFAEERLDLPFVTLKRAGDGDSVDVGPISVSRRTREEDVEVGPFTFNPCDWVEKQLGQGRMFSENGGQNRDTRGRRRRASSLWLAKGSQGPSYLSASPDGAQARWNGTSLRVKGDSMKMAVGSDGFVYTPTELETYSPLHSLHVTRSKATLNTKKFTLNISGNRVILRAENGSRSTDSAGLAKDLLQLLTETANKQVKSVMEGQPMELDDLLLGTEEVLKKYE
jgi:hypothetical protein